MNEEATTTTLLVNLDSSERRTHSAFLKDMGYPEILHAGTGSEAWSIIKNFTINLIISSWFLLQDMSGLGLLKVIRTDPAYSEIPFMLMVEEVTKDMVIEAARAGVTEMLVIPFSRETFFRKVNIALKGDDDPQLIETKRMIDQGSKLMAQGKYEEALSTFQRVVKITESAEIYYNLGYIRTAQGRYEEALIAFRKATQLNEAFAKAYQKMGDIYAKLGRPEEARRFFAKAADIYMDRKQDAKAEGAFMKVLEVNPNTPNVFNSLGIVYRRQGKFSEAVKMYKKALRVNPDDEHIHYNLARSFIGAKLYPEAANILRNAVNLNPEFIEAKNLLRSVERTIGKP